MVAKMKRLFEKYRKKHEFSAENCRRKQNLIQNDKYLRKVEEICARIDFVVSNSTDEHAVIYRIRKEQQEIYDRIANYFCNRGFLVVKTHIDELQDEYLIISW